MPDVGWICMLHPVITNPLSLQLCYFHYKPLLFTTTLFPAELSSGSGFSSCAISLPVCVGTVPHQSLFGGTARSSTLLPTSQGCVQHVTCATSIVPRLGGFVHLQPSHCGNGKRAVPCSAPRQVGGSEVWIQTKVLCAQQRRKEEGSLGCSCGSFRAVAAIVNGWALRSDKPKLEFSI